VRGPRCTFNIKKAFTCTCQTTRLVYCISCLRCPVLYIGETGRTFWQRFGEHLRNIKKNLSSFPIAEHFNKNGHSVRGILLCDGNRQRKQLQMRLKLGTSQLRGLNFDFRRVRASSDFFKIWHRGALSNEH